MNNTLTVAEIKRRGMAAIEDGLRHGPVHIIKRNKPAAVVLTEDDYQRLAHGRLPASGGMTAVQWLLALPAGGRRSKARIDADLKAGTRLVIVFYDTSALIYLIEGKEPFAGKVRKELAEAARKYPELGSCVSRLTWLECRVGPMKAGNNAVLATFDEFFSRPDLIWVELTKEVVELAAAIRVRHGLRTPDALQAASCLQLGSDHIFFTGDMAFKRVEGLDVKVLA